MMTYQQAQHLRELVADLGDLPLSAAAVRAVLAFRFVRDEEIEAGIEELLSLGHVEERAGQLLITRLGATYIDPLPGPPSLRHALTTARRASWLDSRTITV